MEIYNYYVDNGYSGTDFDRPGLKRMIKDIESKKIDVVIVKDLSRIGRNYIEVGELIDSILPLYDIKLISVYACSSYVRKRGCSNKKTIRKDILEEKVIMEINNIHNRKIGKLNRKYIYDLINMIYLNKDGLVNLELKKK